MRKVFPAIKNRYQAFTVHLCISAGIVCIAFAVIFLVWYPMPIDKAIGVGNILMILFAVDVTIGPVITFIIYKPNKPSLKFDLTVVALLQLGALGYGMHTIYDGRPAFIVFSKDRFEIARASDIDPDSVKTALQEGNAAAVPGWTGPLWVGALASKDLKRNNQIMFSSVLGGPDWPLLPELYVPLTQVKAQILERAKPLQELRELHHNYAESIKVLADWHDNKVKWLPLVGKVRNMVVLVDADSADIVKIVDIDPWM